MNSPDLSTAARLKSSYSDNNGGACQLLAHIAVHQVFELGGEALLTNHVILRDITRLPVDQPAQRRGGYGDVKGLKRCVNAGFSATATSLIGHGARRGSRSVCRFGTLARVDLAAWWAERRRISNE